MGTQNSTQKKQQTNSQVSQIKHPKLAMGKIIKTSDQSIEPYIKIATTISDEFLYKSWQKQAQNYRQGQNFIQTLYLPKFLIFQKTAICGSSGTLIAEYEIFPYVLKQEIKNRKTLNQPFNEQEIWYLIYILNSGGAFLHSTGRVIGDVRPNNILINDEGEIQVISLGSFIEEETNFCKFLTSNQITYLSPEQMEALRMGQTTDKIDPIHQCFSIGLTILQIMLLSDQSQIYSKDFQFQKQIFEQQLSKLNTLHEYHPLQKKLVEALLCPNRQNRLCCLQVLEWLKKFEPSIMNLEEFQILHTDVPANVAAKLTGFTLPPPIPSSSNRQNVFTYKDSLYSRQGTISESNRMIEQMRRNNIIESRKNSFQFNQNNKFTRLPQKNHNNIIVTQSVYTPPPPAYFVHPVVKNQESHRLKAQSIQEIHKKPTFHYKNVEKVEEKINQPKFVENSYSINKSLQSQQSHQQHQSHQPQQSYQFNQSHQFNPSQPSYNKSIPSTHQQKYQSAFHSYDEAIKDINSILSKSKAMFPS